MGLIVGEVAGKSKIMRRVILLLAVALAGLYSARNVIVCHAVEARWPVTIGRLNLQVFRGRLEARQVQWRNATMLVDAVAVTVDYRTPSVLRGAPHLREMDVRIAEITLTQPAAGPGGAGPPAPGRRSARLDLLRVHVGTVVLQTPTTVKRFPLNQTIVFENVTELADVWRAVSGQVGEPRTP